MRFRRRRQHNVTFHVPDQSDVVLNVGSCLTIDDVTIWVDGPMEFSVFLGMTDEQLSKELDTRVRAKYGLVNRSFRA